MDTTASRRLIWVPIIHSPEDLGSVRESVRRHFIRKVGKGQWDRHLRTIEDLWRAIRAGIEGLNLDYARVRLYQDGLPVCGHEQKIISELADAGSLNHRLLLDLMARGGTLMGTESAELLVREYALTRQMLHALDTPARAELVA